MKKIWKWLLTAVCCCAMALASACTQSAEPTPPVQPGVTGEWDLLFQYEDETTYRIGQSSYAREDSEELNVYIVEIEDQIARPEEITFTFTADMEHSVVSIDAKRKLISHEKLGKGTHTKVVEDNAAMVAFIVHDSEEADFSLVGKGAWQRAETALTGTYFSVLGDSLSTYYCYIPEGNRNYYEPSDLSVQSMWWQVMARQTGMIPLVINASGGSGVTELSKSGGTAGNSERCEQLSLGGRDPEEIFVLLGGNDVVQGVDVQTLQQSYLEMVDRIRAAYPQANLHLCTYFPIPALGEEKVDALNDVIRSVAQTTGVDLIDTAQCGITEKDFLDTLHINADGQETFGGYAADHVLS